MKILSIWCPWAQLILLGGKDVENRGWSTTYRGPLAIHASKGNHNSRDVNDILDQLVDDGMIGASMSSLIEERIPFDRGKVIGVVDLVGVSSKSESPWWVDGQFALKLANPSLLEVPVPHRGEQGLRPYSFPPGIRWM